MSYSAVEFGLLSAGSTIAVAKLTSSTNPVRYITANDGTVKTLSGSALTYIANQGCVYDEELVPCCLYKIEGGAMSSMCFSSETTYDISARDFTLSTGRSSFSIASSKQRPQIEVVVNHTGTTTPTVS